MSLTKVIEELRAQQLSKVQEVKQIGKAIQLLQSGSDVKMIGTGRRMSPEAIEKIREAAKKRWAGIKKAPTSKKGS